MQCRPGLNFWRGEKNKCKININSHVEEQLFIYIVHYMNYDLDIVTSWHELHYLQNQLSDQALGYHDYDFGLTCSAGGRERQYKMTKSAVKLLCSSCGVKSPAV